MRTDTHQTHTRSNTGYTTHFGRQVKHQLRYQGNVLTQYVQMVIITPWLS